ncbi:glycosyltransferase [Acanthopleuribacter pedis]|uniref:Glycosyltransferase family 1 protein n=1 Tax=Acanthopleuribacter pedis TaxID=442870 RepID=A0A8J7U2J7_9BACT|nr:glycosyltransferase [Acanthopleuribacter pedis]MBO1317789.1 glycosyltransferase family 1 protein [Acanthopleuribacter pedis]
MQPLKTALFTLGTMGDIHMYLPLAKQIQAAGHAVQFCTYACYREKVTRVGIPFTPIPPDIEADFFTQIYDDVKDKNLNDKAESSIDRLFLRDIEQRFEACLAIIKQCDLVICHQVDWAAQIAAELAKVPWVQGIPGPFGMPNEGFVPRGLRTANLGAPLNKMTWRFLIWMMGKTLFRGINRFGRKVGSKRKDLGFFSMSPHLNLLATSPHLAILPKNMPPATVATGPWSLSEPDYELSDELRRFLASGPAPAVIGFGSMGGNSADGKTTAEMVIEALRETNQRMVIQRGWGRLVAGDDPNIMCADYIPHEHLFPHAAFVMHHGGAGTTAAAAKAGVPQIVIAHSLDQFYWGDMVARRNLGPPLLARQKLSQSQLTERIRHLLGNAAAMRAGAATLADHLRREDGPAAAVTAIETFYTHHTQHNAAAPRPTMADPDLTPT